MAPTGPKMAEHGPKSAPRGSPNTTHDPTTRHTTHHAPRTTSGAVPGTTGARRPKNHTNHHARFNTHYSHYGRRGSWNDGRDEAKEPHTKHCTRRTTHHTHYGPWDSNAGPKLWEERCAGVPRWKSDLLNHEPLQPQRLVHYYSLLSFFPPSPCTGSAASIYTYGSLCSHSLLWVSGSRWPGGDARSAKNPLRLPPQLRPP